jgi:integrase
MSVRDLSESAATFATASSERDHQRVQRERVEDLTVNDLLDLYVLDCEDKTQPIQLGRVEPWRAVLGPARAIEVGRDQLDAICRRWRKAGPKWDAGERVLSDGRRLTWAARDPKRVRPLSSASCNRLVAVLRRAFRLGHEKRGLLTPLTFPRYDEGERGEYLTEDQCRAISRHFQAKEGAAVKADVFRLAYLLGTRKGQLRGTLRKHVLISGDAWKLRWPGTATKGGKRSKKSHEVVLVGEPLEIVQRAWGNRRPECDHLFHVNGKPLGPMLSKLKRTCEVLGIPYGRGRGIVFHDTRHSAVTNLVAAGTGEAVAMTITAHQDPSVFKRYNVRRDDVQADALARQQSYLAAKRGTTPTPTDMTRCEGTTLGHDSSHTQGPVRTQD